MSSEKDKGHALWIVILGVWSEIFAVGSEVGSTLDVIPAVAMLLPLGFKLIARRALESKMISQCLPKSHSLRDNYF